LLPFDVDGKKFNARRLDDPNLSHTNPIALISDELPGAASDMGAETIFVSGAKFGDGRGGFILLEDRAGRAPLDNAHAEDLQDHTCGVAH
jgi:CDP-diacylglycerol pyrophosphatase